MGKITLVLIALLFTATYAVSFSKTIKVDSKQGESIHYIGKFAVGEDKQLYTEIKAKILGKANISFFRNKGINKAVSGIAQSQ